jgi:hypothetical protein
MRFLTAKKQGVFTYYGHSYELEPITFPEVNIRNILVTSYHLDAKICKENPDTMQGVTFDASKLPGYPKLLTFPPQDLPAGSRLMLVRGGGIGDVIMLTPALKKLKQLVGDRMEIVVSTFADRIPLLDGLGYVDRFFPHPVRLYDFMNAADYYLDFSDPKKIFNFWEMIDFHLDCLSFDPSAIPAPEKIPELPEGLFRSARMAEAISSVRPEGKTAVLYAGMASDRIRHLPSDILDWLARAYPDTIFLLPGNTTGPCGGSPNTFTIDTSAGLEDYVTAIRLCDILVSTDSSAYHIAAATGTPSLVFFGPIGSKTRTGYYPLVVALDSSYQGLTCHAPCGISAIEETPPAIPIGANGATRLVDGMEITTFTGETFVFDHKKGCPDANAAGSSCSPCLAGFTREAVIASFEKVLALFEGLKAQKGWSAGGTAP